MVMEILAKQHGYFMGHPAETASVVSSTANAYRQERMYLSDALAMNL